MTTELFHFEEFESLRDNDRRLYHEMKMPNKHRIELLKNCGVTMYDIRKVTRMVQKCKSKRIKTNMELRWAPLQERNEKIKRKFKNVFTGYKKKERQYIEHALTWHTL